ncbi:SoxR reducing system RseC family protein [Desulfococcaceae bacterium HSG9]|nr:SoxR reducing system RseC family protein [Desulfococcaceae bacterium HSG9]
MAYEQGIVTELTDTGAWIKTQKNSACAACSARQSCKTGGGEEAKVEVRNDVNAHLGDRVVIYFKTTSLLKAAFLLYMVPILGLLAGAGIGQKIAQLYAIQGSLPAVLVGFSSFAATVLWVKLRANRLSDQDSYQPRITRIIKKAAPGFLPSE